MERVLHPEEMRRADEATISAGTPGVVLMDRAAHACAVVALRMLGGGHGRRVVAVCGKGSNGGDGIAAGRYLGAAGANVTLSLLAEPTGDAAAHLAMARRCGSPGRLRIEPFTPEAFGAAAAKADLVVDAIFGTGFSGEPRGDAAAALEAVAGSGPPVLAVDIPSGVSGVDGSVPGAAVTADVTVAIQALKAGHVLSPGALHCGRIDVAEVGIATPDTGMWVPSARDVAASLPESEPDTHKYRRGVVAVFGGSPGMTGAAILTASGALRAGAGLVVLGVPRSSLEVIEQAVVEAVKIPLPDTEGQLGAKAVDEMEDRLERAGSVAVGPGIGRGPRAVALVRRVLEVDRPVVVDADGLTALAELLGDDPDILGRRTAPTVLTPHGGEFERLTGKAPGPDRIVALRDAAERWRAVVHLKGRRALTVAPDGRAWVNPTGNPGMATGGTGDVLTGVVASLCAQGMDAAAATWAGAYLHGAAGDAAAARFGRRSMTAGDLASALPVAFRRLGVDEPRGSIRTLFEHPEAGS